MAARSTKPKTTEVVTEEPVEKIEEILHESETSRENPETSTQEETNTAELVEATAEVPEDVAVDGIPAEDVTTVAEGIGVEDIPELKEEAKVEPTPEPEAIKDLPALEGVVFEKYADGKTKEEADADYKAQEANIQELLIKAKLAQRW